MSQSTVAIVGAGHAGVQVAAGLRAKKWPGKILLFEQGHDLPYERPPLSKELLKPEATEESAVLRKEKYYADRDIDLRRNVQVTALRPEDKTLVLSDGDTVAYDAVVLATGSVPRKVDIPGQELLGVQVLRTKPDALALKRQLEKAKHVVIVGAGYIGLEVAAAARTRGAEVTIVEFQDRVMSRVTSEPVSDFFAELHRSKGARIVLGASVSEIVGGEDGTVRAVRTAAGDEYPADRVVVGVGVQPNQQLAEAAGIPCDNGILVDAQGATSVPGVYAVGDVTRFSPQYYPGSLRLECIQNAIDQADAVAATIAGATVKTDAIPWFWSVQHDVRLQTVGVRHPEDEVVLRGAPEDGSFVVLYTRNGRLVAADTVQYLKDFMAAKKLIAAGARVDPVLAADIDRPLSEAVVLEESA